MTAAKDGRTIKIYMIGMTDGRPVRSHAADVWQDSNGLLTVSGIWDGVVPLSIEDNAILADESDVSPLEVLRRRLTINPLLSLEILQ